MFNSSTLPFQIKICGLTQPQHAIDARDAGADAIGLNFFESSIRYTPEEQALLIAASARSKPATPTQAIPQIVGVFVNHSIDRILQLASSVKLDGIQLHGNETVEFFAELQKAAAECFDPNGQPFFVRALRTQPKNDQLNSDLATETNRVIEQIQSWSASGVDTILIDAAATGEFGGTGKSIDWTLLPQFQASSSQPLVLAGGLTPSNVGRAIKIAQVKMVDVASGVESTKGIKCPERVQKFVQQARLALPS